MELTPAFAVPIHHSHLRPCERLNAELAALFLARESQDYRNPAPSHIPQAQMFESRFDLFTWPETCIQELRQFMLETVFRVAIAASQESPDALARLHLNNHTWFHITRRTGHFVSHNHAMTSWSAVYCVKDGAQTAGAAASNAANTANAAGTANAAATTNATATANAAGTARTTGAPMGGLLRLFDTRTGADAFRDPANRALRQPFAVGNLDLQLVPGQLVVFPSYLFHEVTPYYGADTRITVASNCWFTA